MARTDDVYARLIRRAVSSLAEVNKVGGTRPAKELQEVKNKIFDELPQCQRHYQELTNKHPGISDMRLMNFAVAKTVLENLNGSQEHQNTRLFFQGIHDACHQKISGDPERAKVILEDINGELCLGVTDSQVSFIKATSLCHPNSLKHLLPYFESKILLMAEEFQKSKLRTFATL